jgi:hypothetical protein
VCLSVPLSGSLPKFWKIHYGANEWESELATSDDHLPNSKEDLERYIAALDRRLQAAAKRLAKGSQMGSSMGTDR